MRNKNSRVTHAHGERVLMNDALYEVTGVAATRWGSETYRLQSSAAVGAERDGRWLTPRGRDLPAPYIDAAALETLVSRFYGRIQEHPELAEVFATRIQADAWPAHLSRMVHFWSAVLLAAPGFSGNPMQKHRELDAAVPAHFGAWLTLFEDVANEVFNAEAAATVVARARRIADRLSQAMFGVPHSRSQCA